MHGTPSERRISGTLQAPPVKDPQKVEEHHSEPPVHHSGLRDLTAPAGSPTDSPCQRSTLAHIIAKVEQLAAQRGEILAQCNGTKGPRYREYVHTNLEKIDSEIRKYLSTLGGDSLVDGSVIQALVEKARISQDVARFESLVRHLQDLGVTKGESYSRDKGSNREALALQEIQSAQAALTRYHTDLSPLGASDSSMMAHIPKKNGDTPSVETACNAALALGRREGIRNRIGAEVAAAKIQRAIGGWKEYIPFAFAKDFSAVQTTLAGLTSREIALVNEAYKDRAGEGLKGALLSAFGKKRGRQIECLLAGEVIGESAARVVGILGSTFSFASTKGDALRKVYKELSPSEILQVETTVASILKIPSEKFHTFLSRKIPPQYSEQLDAYRVGDLEGAVVIRLHGLLHGGAGERINARKVFRDLSTEEIQVLSVRYLEQYGVRLVTDIAVKLPDSAARDLCISAVLGDKERFSAAKIACALAYREDYIGSPFLNISAEQRDYLIACYNKVYGKGEEDRFWKDLKVAVWHEDYHVLASMPAVCRVLEHLWWPCMNSYPFIDAIIKNGNLTPAELLRYFMVGVGTDIEGIMAVLEGRSTEEIEEICREYAEKFPPGRISRMLGKVPIIRSFILLGDLRHDLKVETSGDSEFDVSLLMEGLPTNPTDTQLCAAIFSRLERRFTHEQSGKLLGALKLVSLQGDSKILKRFIDDFHIAKTYYDENIIKNPSPTTDQVTRFLALAKIAEIQANTFRFSKTSVAGLVLNSLSFVGATTGAVALIMLSSVSYFEIAFGSFLGSMCWRMTNGKFLLGQGFGKNDLMFQFARAVVDGASFFLARFGLMTLGRFLGTQLSKGVVKSGFKSGLGRFIKTVENKIKHQDKARHVLGPNSSIRTDLELKELIERVKRGILSGAIKGRGSCPPSRHSIEELIMHALGSIVLCKSPCQ